MILTQEGNSAGDTAYNGLGVCILPPMMIAMTDLGNLVLPVLRKKRLKNHQFSEWLQTDTVFKEFTMLSMLGGELEGWFHIICKAMKEEEEKIFDETCQSLMADIWGCLQNSCEFGGSIASILSPYVHARVKQ